MITASVAAVLSIAASVAALLYTALLMIANALALAWT